MFYSIYQYTPDGGGIIANTFSGTITDLKTLVDGLKTSTGLDYYAEQKTLCGSTKVYDTITDILSV